MIFSSPSEKHGLILEVSYLISGTFLIKYFKIEIGKTKFKTCEKKIYAFPKNYGTGYFERHHKKVTL